ncbi:MAG TPA: transglycosylase SLT domain-containing protein [Polyangiaceae bacterium]|nr:transglycosylase SLT domain-containing protein [Polyangiaceae bacterium]
MRALRPLICFFAITAASASSLAAPKQSDSKKTEPKKAEPKKAEPKKAEPKKAEPKKAEPKKAEPKKAPSKQARPRKATPSDAKRSASKEEAKAESARKPEGEPAAGQIGPGAGSGTRSVGGDKPKGPSDAPTVASTPDKAAPETKTEAKVVDAPEAPSHRKGRRPKTPSATLPKGAARPEVSSAARRAIAGGPTLPDLEAKPEDPELAALRDAERVLFPKPLMGFEPVFAWPSVAPRSGGPEVVASGLPADARLAPKASTDESVVTAEWIRSLTLPNVPVRLESRVIRYLKFYRDNARGKAIAKVWAKKSGRFTPALKAELAKAGLPTDLVWLSLIESGHNPTIGSPAGAAGLWQFMPETGRMYGLVVDRWVDERLDPLRSTSAAIGYLSDLYRRFGNWELAMAGYNMGHGGLSRAIQKFNTNDYWELSKHEAGIPWETTLYVPKIIAIAIVMNNKKAFGIADVAADPAERFETVLVPPGTPLSVVATAARVSESSLERLNPQLLSGRVPPNRPGQRAAGYYVRVPPGKAATAGSQLPRLSSDEPALSAVVAKLGDTPESVAQSSGASLSQLKRINRLSSNETLAAGNVLLVPAKARPAGVVSTPDVVVMPDVQVSYADRERVFLVVRDGDTLPGIARTLGVSSAELERFNALDPTARLLSGMTLQAWVKKGADVGAQLFRAHETKVLIMGSPEFIEHFEGQNGKTRLVVHARAGETLARIGRRFGISSGWMERINRKSRHKKLKAGDDVVVYVRKGNAVASGQPDADDTPSPLLPVTAPAPEGLPALPEAPSAGSGTTPSSG